MRCADFDQRAGVHDRDLIGDGQGFGLIMGNENRRDAGAPLQRFDLRPHLYAELRVEIAQRLVENITLGSLMRARANATRCCCPPESFGAGRSSKPSRPTIFKTSTTLRLISSLAGVESSADRRRFPQPSCAARSRRIERPCQWAACWSAHRRARPGHRPFGRRC